MSQHSCSGPSRSYKIYVAGLALERARGVMDELRAHGHTITYDWVADYTEHDEGHVEEHAREAAASERAAVQASDVLVYLWEEGQESARTEFGMALGINIPVIAVGQHEAFFYLLPEVRRVATDAEIADALRSLEDGPAAH